MTKGTAPSFILSVVVIAMGVILLIDQREFLGAVSFMWMIQIVAGAFRLWLDIRAMIPK